MRWLWLGCLHHGSRMFSGKQIAGAEHNSQPNWDTSGDAPAVLVFSPPPSCSYSKYLEKRIFHTQLQKTAQNCIKMSHQGQLHPLSKADSTSRPLLSSNRLLSWGQNKDKWAEIIQRHKSAPPEERTFENWEKWNRLPLRQSRLFEEFKPRLDVLLCTYQALFVPTETNNQMKTESLA